MLCGDVAPPASAELLNVAPVPALGALASQIVEDRACSARGENPCGGARLLAQVQRADDLPGAWLRILDLAILAAILTITYFAMRRFGKPVAFAAIILFGLKYLQGGPALSLQREYLILIFISLSIRIGVTDSLDVRKRLMLGLLYGMAALIKPHAALGLAPFLLFDIADLRQRRELSLPSLAKQIVLPAAIGFAIPVSFITLWLAFTNSLMPFTTIALNYWPLYSQINGEMAITPSAERTAYLLNHRTGLPSLKE